MMAEVTFIFNGRKIIIQGEKNKKMREICNNLSRKINIELNSLVFLYGGRQLDFDKTFKEISNENKIKILVYTNEDDNKVCSKCGRMLDNKIIDEILLLNNNINDELNGLKINIDL